MFNVSVSPLPPTLYAGELDVGQIVHGGGADVAEIVMGLEGGDVCPCHTTPGPPDVAWQSAPTGRVSMCSGFLNHLILHWLL